MSRASTPAAAIGSMLLRLLTGAAVVLVVVELEFRSTTGFTAGCAAGLGTGVAVVAGRAATGAGAAVRATVRTGAVRTAVCVAGTAFAVAVRAVCFTVRTAWAAGVAVCVALVSVADDWSAAVGAA